MATLADRTDHALKDSEDFRSIRRSLAQLVASKTTHHAGHPMQARHDIYTNPARWEAERSFLRDTPLFAGLSIEILHSGDVLTFDHVGPQIMIIRQKDGGIKGFLNMCTHRAARIVSGLRAGFPPDLPVSCMDFRPRRHAQDGAGQGVFRF